MFVKHWFGQWRHLWVEADMHADETSLLTLGNHVEHDAHARQMNYVNAQQISDLQKLVQKHQQHTDCRIVALTKHSCAAIMYLFDDYMFISLNEFLLDRVRHFLWRVRI